VLQAALLGIVQGLTEFLPVSSSGHLILARAVLGWDTERFGLPFDVACHVGTLLALVIYFRRELGALVAGVPSALATPASPDARLLWLIGLGTIPIVVVVALFGDAIETTLRTPRVAIGALVAGALALFVAERAGAQTRDESSLGAASAVMVGAAQSLALIPGVSRSGATIAAGMLVGLRRDVAARFGFLLGVPAIVAAAVKSGIDLSEAGVSADAAALMVTGLLTSAAVGYLTITYFIRYLVSHSLAPFAWYRLGVAGFALWWLSR
jgi:undecaprenyl-diphosphatase